MIKVSYETAAHYALKKHRITEKAPKDAAMKVIEEILGLNAQGSLNYELSLWK